MLLQSAYVLRGLVAFLLASVVSVPLGSGGTPGSTHDGPESFSVPSPRVGDAGEYRVTSERARNGEWTTFIEARVVFEWGAAAEYVDEFGARRNGVPLRVQSFIGEGSGWQETGGMTAWWDDGSIRRITHRGNVSYGIGFGAGLVLARHHSANFDVRGATFGEGDKLQDRLPCGLNNPLQGSDLRAAESFEVSPACAHRPSPASLTSKRATELDGAPAYLFEEAGPRPIQAWLAAGIPYVVRLSVPSSASETRIVTQLVAFEGGAVDFPALGASDPSRPPTFGGTPWEPWGPSEEGLDHPFALSEAYRLSIDSNETVKRFLEEHPRAYLQAASYVQWSVNERERRTWSLVFTDGREQLQSCPERSNRVPLPRDDADWALSHVPWSEPSDRFVPCWTKAPPPADPDVVPASGLNLRELAERWRAYAGSQEQRRGINAWGFEIRAGTDGRAIVEYEIGFLEFRAEEGVLNPVLDDSNWTLDVSATRLDAQGRALSHQWIRFDRSTRHEVSPRVPGSMGPESMDPFRKAPAPQPPSRPALPAGAIAGIVGLGLLGLLYWALPFLRSGALVALFSRVEKPEAIDHPMRARIHALVEANPGIHFLEIVRRLGSTRGRTEHHLRILVQLGLLTTRSGPGNTYYFVPGNAVPFVADAIKAPSARRLLAAVAEMTPVSFGQLGSTTGLSPGTVTYHLKRLRERGLVESHRGAGRLFIRITPLGRRVKADIVEGATA